MNTSTPQYEELGLFIETNNEALKKVGAISWLLNRAEASMMGDMTLLLQIDSSNAGKNSLHILNRMFFNPYVIASLKHKSTFVRETIKFVAEVAQKNSITFDQKKYESILGDLEILQSVRNKLLHRVLSFSVDGGIATHRDKDNKPDSIDLDDILEQMKMLVGNNGKVMSEFVLAAREILKLPN